VWAVEATLAGAAVVRVVGLIKDKAAVSNKLAVTKANTSSIAGALPSDGLIRPSSAGKPDGGRVFADMLLWKIRSHQEKKGSRNINRLYNLLTYLQHSLHVFNRRETQNKKEKRKEKILGKMGEKNNPKTDKFFRGHRRSSQKKR
jgi:hypothetical protein